MKTYLDYVATNTGFGDKWLKIAGMKLGSDSMPLNKTSWMHEEYVGGGNGHLLGKGDTDEEDFNAKRTYSYFNPLSEQLDADANYDPYETDGDRTHAHRGGNAVY